MNSKHVKDGLSAFLDKELNAEEMLDVEEHLRNCTECREEYEALQDTVQRLSSMKEVIPPASFRHELREKLERCNKKPGFSLNTLISGWMKTINQRRLLPAAVVIVLVLVMIPFVGANLPKMGLSQKAADSSVAMGGPTEEYNQLTSEEQLRKMMAPDGKGEEVGIAAPQAPASGKMTDTATQPVEIPNQTYPIIEPNIERKIIKNADIMLQVDDYSIAVEAIKQKAASLGGYVSNENVNTMGREGSINGYLQVRIPALDFDGFLSGIEGLGKLKCRNVYSQDVTEEYVDIESRLKALRTKEERLLDILNKSGQLSDVLAVENELANTRAQLESLEGRLRYLDNRADFSSIGISIEQLTASTKEITNPGFMEIMQKTKEAFIETINNIILGVGELIVFLGSAIPYLLLVGIAAWLFWWFASIKKIK